MSEETNYFSEKADYSLILAFDSDNPEFTRGVEIGLLWSDLYVPKSEMFIVTMHLSNSEMMLRVAETLGYIVRIKELDSVWCEATFFNDREEQAD